MSDALNTPRSLLLQALVSPEVLENRDACEWHGLITLGRRHGLAGRWYSALHERDLLGRLQPDIADQLRAEALVAESRMRALRWEARCAERALRNLGIPLVLLKGAAYDAAGLASGRTRLSADLDILVPREALAAVEQALMEHGWRSVAHDAYDDAYYRNWMHELPPLYHSGRGMAIDVHHNILPLTARFCPPAERLIAAAVKLPGSKLSMLAPADMLLHSIVHGFHDGEFQNPLRDVLDVHEIATHFATRDVSFWDTFTARTVELGFARPAYTALMAASRYCGLPLPRTVLHTLRTAGGRQSLMFEWALDQILVGTLPRTRCQRLAARFMQARSHLHKMPATLLARHLAYKSWQRLRNPESA